MCISLLEAVENRKAVCMASCSMFRHAFAAAYSNISYCLAGSKPHLGEIERGGFVFSAFCWWLSSFPESKKMKIFDFNSIIYTYTLY